MTRPKRKERKDSDLSKKYDTMEIFTLDGVYTFKLSEWLIYKDNEWIELTKKDGSAMDCFAIGNVGRVLFSRGAVKAVRPIIDITPLKPVA